MYLKAESGAKNANAIAVSIRCPACRLQGMFQGIVTDGDAMWATLDSATPGGVKVTIVGPRVCPNQACKAVVFVVLANQKVLSTYPPETLDFDASNLPAPIVATLAEAITCHANGAHRASAIMVRRVLEELCADKGATGRDLNARLEALKSKVILPAELLEAAHELRILGNDAAHLEGRAYDQVSNAEVTVAIGLAKELLKAVYQYASLLNDLRALKKS